MVVVAFSFLNSLRLQNETSDIFSETSQSSASIQAQVKKCNNKLDEWVRKGMDEQGFWCTRETLEHVRKKVGSTP